MTEPIHAAELRRILASSAIRPQFQPIVDLDGTRVVGYEALARGPQDGPLARPDALFAVARTAGLTAELDHACRTAAIEHAARIGICAPLHLFVNVEPEVLDRARLPEIDSVTAGAARLVFEITERAIGARPAELLRTVERIRAHGWAIALDDVGADPSSLAFMALLRPEVVKLDLRLIQERPTAEIASIMHAVNAYTEESGALLLAEGIETQEHLVAALGLGATHGQGWLFGRPGSALAPARHAAARLPEVARALTVDVSPFACLPPETPRRIAGKSLLIELSKQLEREALGHGESAIVASSFQEARHFTAKTAVRYAELATGTAFVCALGRDLPVSPLEGVRGARLEDGDPVLGEWDIVVLTPHFAAALLARDLGDGGPDMQRRFEYALTYRRDAVMRAACALLARVAPVVALRSSEMAWREAA